MGTYETLLVESKGHVSILTLNRPDKLNAWSVKLEMEFLQAIAELNADPNTYVIVVTGAGRAFCAGGDISGFNQALGGRVGPPGPSPLTAEDGSPEVPILLSRSKPVICAINGHAVGIGLTVTMACDIRIASDKAKFSARFVKVGLTPECGSTRYMAAVAGMGNAMFMAMTGRIIEADEALQRNLVDRVVPHDSLMDEVMALANEIAGNPPSAVWAAKRMIHENAAEPDLRRVVTREGFGIRMARGTAEHREAVTAFLEKREPNFDGVLATDGHR
jgi:2-(1,2-epoxy-1,2-dihydrophenyl)acetyl-CoA isomerase